MKSRMIPVLCFLLLFLTACQKQTSDDPVVATYKDTQILQSEVAYEKENQINVTGRQSRQRRGRTGSDPAEPHHAR